MVKIDLSGTWHVTDSSGKYEADAIVPGCVHTDLLAAGLIEDPFYRDNENKLQWISDHTWIYTREFMVSHEVYAQKKIVLNCQGLDTFAALKINGRIVARTDNMFRDFFFDIKSFLRIGSNRIEIAFKPVLPYLEKKQKEHPLLCMMEFKGSAFVRKEPCNFGWDWGPKLITCGIWKNIQILAYHQGKINDCFIKQTHSVKKVRLEIAVEIEKLSSAPMELEALVTFGNKTVACVEAAVRGKKAVLKIDIENPQLWWPNGMGKQPLYHIRLNLKDASGNGIDHLTKTIGLRKLELRQKPDKDGRSFEFVANGKPFFAKGANWIPADSFAPRVTKQHYHILLKSAIDAHMNMLRVWGGGIYENDVFYEICDTLGICVWQDFMFACSMYPTDDPRFMASVETEAADAIKRLRHHPSIALWCGNNELEMGMGGRDKWPDNGMSWDDYGRLFDTLLPKLVSKHDPQRPYWPSSPHTPVGNRSVYNSSCSGDAHLWDVWHGMEPFEWFYQARHRFVSEFGFQSFPEPATVNTYTNKLDRDIASPVMDHHQRNRRGNARIMAYMLEWFRMPKGFENTLWLSQILQALCIKTAVEHFRRQMPRCMGTLYWQLNDCWPVASWASVDYFGRYKALHWAAKRFFAPLLVSTFQLKNDKTALYLCNDSYQDKTVKLVWELFTTAGKSVTSGSQTIKALAFKSICIRQIDFSDYIERLGRGNLVLRVKAIAGRKVLSENTHFFRPPKHVALQKPVFKVKMRKTGDGCFEATITTNRPAFWTRPQTNSRNVLYSDSFFDIFPGEQKKITVRYLGEKVKRNVPKLELHSLWSSYNEQ